MPQLAIAKEFLDRYTELEKRVRRAVNDALDKFDDTHHAGGHLEKITDSRDPRARSLRITRGYRGVVIAPEKGDTYLLVTVLPHDAAYDYIRSRRFSVNQASGVLEVRDDLALETLGTALAPVAAAAPSRLFDHVPDKHLTQLGIDAQALAIVRLLPDEAYLDAIQPMLPAAQHNALVALASGMTVEEAWAEVSKGLVEEVPRAEIDPDDLSAAIRRTPGQAVFVEGPEGLRDMLASPFDLWRVFLHPQQRRIAYRKQYNGPAMVAGGAGTGKTVTALHRVAHLAARSGANGGGGPAGESAPREDSGQSSPGILLTTFTRSLDDALRAQLELLITDTGQLARVDVRNIDRIAYQVVARDRGAKLSFPSGRELERLWEECSEGGEYTGRFLMAEWEQVILAQDLRTERAYLEARRHGRGNRLSVEKRRVVWRVVLEATRRMAEAGQWTFTQVSSEAATVLNRTGERLYEHVVVDEAQDLHPAKWRLIRALVPEGPDDLFIAGDPHQRIYDHRVSLSGLGINVRGRSRRLTVSYRSTQEILTWAVQVLGVSPVTGLDGLGDSLDSYVSPLHGRKPVLSRHHDRSAELDALVGQVEGWLADGVEPDAIGVAARTRATVVAAAERLADAGIGNGPLVDGSGVRVGTMHAMKGLEFRCVAVVGVDADHLPLERQVTTEDADPVARGHDLQRERNLLFVACTRARDALYVSHAGSPSPFLP